MRTLAATMEQPTAIWLANYFSVTTVVSNPGAVSTTTFSYDLNGNLTSGITGATTTSYAYDYLNRLATSTVGSVTTTYGYDALGNRVFETTGNTTTVFPSKYFSVVTTTGSGTSA
jgi:large repetitive protein